VESTHQIAGAQRDDAHGVTAANPALVRAFSHQHRHVIYKSTSGVRSIVQRLEEADFERLDRIRWCPTQFQVFVPGTNVRVPTIGDRGFATAISSDATDDRRSRLDIPDGSAS
jgi:hypothetical protein